MITNQFMVDVLSKRQSSIPVVDENENPVDIVSGDYVIELYFDPRASGIMKDRRLKYLGEDRFENEAGMEVKTFCAVLVKV